MKKIPLLSALVFFSFSGVFGQGFAGDWSGKISVRGSQLRLVFHIVKNGDSYTTTMDSPDQGAKGLPVGKTTLNGNQVAINASQYGINYTGTYLPDSNKINGTFPQGGMQIALNLTWSKPTTVSRPQDPKDFPYKQEQITFENTKGGDRLAGTLTLPADGKATNIVILITGSGPQNRTEEVLGHRPFLVWSDWLTRHGIAVLRYDDRGTGESTGNFNAATTADFAADAEAAVNYIQSREDLKKLSIGLMGHSEGGLIAPMVASRNRAVKFIVLLAGPGVPIVQLMTRQAEDQLRIAGASAQAIELTTGTDNKAYTLIAANTTLSNAQLKPKLDTLMYTELRTYPKAYLGGSSIDELVRKADATLLSPWYRYFISMDPAVYLTRVKCPVLALDGTKDMQVNAEANLAAIKANVEKGGNKNVETVMLPDLNHLFQKAQKGSVEEYAQIEETIDPVVLQKVSGWINGLR